tara:strand:- start:3356 stop:3481 length:126 start_codon:yes stop_codon:yes gene_type:complete
MSVFFMEPPGGDPGAGDDDTLPRRLYIPGNRRKTKRFHKVL